VLRDKRTPRAKPRRRLRRPVLSKACAISSGNGSQVLFKIAIQQQVVADLTLQVLGNRARGKLRLEAHGARVHPTP
jgi:hypothetical protein